MPKPETDLTHFLQLRLSPWTVTEIDRMIATVPEFADFSRSSFIRTAIRYAFYSAAEHKRMFGTESRS